MVKRWSERKLRTRHVWAVRLLLTQNGSIIQYLVSDIADTQKDCVPCFSLFCWFCVTCLHHGHQYQAQFWIPEYYWFTQTQPEPQKDWPRTLFLQNCCQPAFCLWKHLILRWMSLLRGLKSMIAHALIKGLGSDRLWHYLIYSFSFRAADHCFVN